MKVIVYTMAGAIVFGFAMAGWSIGGRLMSAPSDGSLMKGFLILAGLVGAGGALAAGLVKVCIRADEKEIDSGKKKV